MEFGRVVIGFKQRNMEYGVKSGEVGWETKLVDEVGEFSLYRERAETDVVEFVGGTSGFDVTTEEPDELVGGERRRVGNATVVVLRLMVLCELEVCVKLIVNTGEVVVEISSSRNIDRIRKMGLESGIEAEVHKERGHFC